METKPHRLEIEKTIQTKLKFTPAEIITALNQIPAFDRLSLLMPALRQASKEDLKKIHEAFPHALKGLVAQLETQLRRYRAVSETHKQHIKIQQMLRDYEDRLHNAQAVAGRSIRKRENRQAIQAYDLIVADLKSLIGEPKPETKEGNDG